MQKRTISFRLKRSRDHHAQLALTYANRVYKEEMVCAEEVKTNPPIAEWAVFPAVLRDHHAQQTLSRAAPLLEVAALQKLV